MVKEEVVKRQFKVLTEEISPENVQVISELIAMKCTKLLIGFTGQFCIEIHNNLYSDIINKNVYGYIFSDSYELVQTVALFLCEHFGEHLDDYYYSSNKGKRYTLKMYCYKLIDRIVCTKYRRRNTDVCLHALGPCRLSYELTDENPHDYSRVDEIVDSMNLTENHKTVINYRMSGVTYSEIGEMLNRKTSTVFDLLCTVRRRYISHFGEL